MISLAEFNCSDIATSMMAIVKYLFFLGLVHENCFRFEFATGFLFELFFLSELGIEDLFTHPTDSTRDGLTFRRRWTLLVAGLLQVFRTIRVRIDTYFTFDAEMKSSRRTASA